MTADDRADALRRALRLYAVTDRAWVGRQTFAEQMEAALRGGATCLQLREKDLPDDAFLAEALDVRRLCERHGVPMIVNDNLDVALRADADGVHVGQSDHPAAEVRRLLGPGPILGVSAQTVDQALEAERAGADYLGVGAVFPTATKRDADAVPLSTLRAICAAVRIPVVAIGGIAADNLAQLRGSGIAGVAVVSALFAQPDIETATRALLARLQEVLP